MAAIIGVQFQKNGKMYYFDANGLDVKAGDYVVVDTSRGNDLGEVVMGTRQIEDDKCLESMKKTIRIATEQDLQRGRDNRIKEKEAFTICQKKIAEHKLEMKLVSVEYSFDNSKVLFFFTANGRVDFRSLVKDLASIFKMRIELRQIGVRDEAKMLGGLGPCGRPICCGTFLDQFQPVSIKMAKEQNLSLNPTKISGVCGRLMCCLKYEQEHYESTRKRMPKVGREVITPDGTGPVTELNIVKETVFVRLVNGDTSEIKEYPLENITLNGEGSNRGEAAKKNSRDNHSTDHDLTGLPESIPEEIPDKTDIPGQPDKETPDAPSRQTDNTRQRNRNKSRKSALGQPVRRENPNRDADRRENGEKQGKEAHEPGHVTEAPGKSSGTPWADAVMKAMREIDQSN